MPTAAEFQQALGKLALGQRGRMQPQGAANYSGTGAPANYQAPAGSGPNQAAAVPGALGPRPAPSAPAPTAAPVVNNTRKFNVGAQEWAQRRAGAWAAPGLMGTYTGGGLQPAPGSSVAGAGPKPGAFGGFTGQQTLPSIMGGGPKPGSFGGFSGQQAVGGTPGVQGVVQAPKPQVLGAAAPGAPQQPGPLADQSAMGPKAFKVGGNNAMYKRLLRELGFRDDQSPTLPERDVSPSAVASNGDGGTWMGDWVNQIGQMLFNDAVGASSGMAERLNGATTDYDNSVMGAWNQTNAALRDAGLDAMSPANQAAAEAAARQSLEAGVNRQRDAAVAQMLDRQNRGGRIGSNAVGEAYGTAANAISEGERGLTQDAFGRKMQALGMGANIAGQANQDLYGKQRDLYATPSDMLQLLFQMGPEFLDAINPVPFT